MVTMEQIAAELKLSRTTVSLALGGQWQAVGIAPATRDQVVAKAKELGYIRNPIATSLRTRVTKTIGIIVPNISGDAYEYLLHGIGSALGDEYTLLLGVSEYDGEKERKLLGSFQQRMVDGLVVVHAGCDDNVSVLKELIQGGVPIVQADRAYEDLAADRVEADNEGIGFSLTEHFLAKGHRQVLHLRSTSNNSGTRARVEGYCKAMRKHRLTPRLSPEEPLSSNQDRAEFGHGLARSLLGRTRGRCCIVAHELGIAFGAIRAVNELARQGEVSIGTVANASSNPIYEFLPRNVTLAVWSVRDMGHHAGKLVLQRLREDPENRAKRQTIRIPGRILARRHASDAAPTPGWEGNTKPRKAE